MRQPPRQQLLRPLGLGLRGPWPPPQIDSLLLGCFDTGPLSLASVLLLHLRDREQYRRDHLAHRPLEVDLLRHRHDSQAAFAPVTQDVQPVSELAR